MQSFRSMRILHIVFLAAIFGYFAVAERFFVLTKDVPVIVVAAFSGVSTAVIVIALVFRRRLLAPAIEALQRDASDAKALVQWRAANTLSIVLAMSVALDGLALRAMGCDRQIVWPFFIVSIILMLMWKPSLDDRIISAGASSPPRLD